MQIEVKGRNIPVTDDLRELSRRGSARSATRCRTWPRWRSSSTRSATRPTRCRSVAETTLYLKGVTLRAQDSSRDMGHAHQPCSDELARQVKRHRDKRRKRREARSPDKRARPDPD